MERCSSLRPYRHLRLLHPFAISHLPRYQKLLLPDHGIDPWAHQPGPLAWGIRSHIRSYRCPRYPCLGSETRKNHHHCSRPFKDGDGTSSSDQSNWSMSAQENLPLNLPGRRTGPKGRGRLHSLPPWYPLIPFYNLIIAGATFKKRFIMNLPTVFASFIKP